MIMTGVLGEAMYNPDDAPFIVSGVDSTYGLDGNRAVVIRPLTTNLSNYKIMTKHMETLLIGGGGVGAPV